MEAVGSVADISRCLREGGRMTKIQMFESQGYWKSQAIAGLVEEQCCDSLLSFAS